MGLREHGLEVRHLGHLPQQAHVARPSQSRGHGRVGGERGEGMVVVGPPRARKLGPGRPHLQARREPRRRREVQIRVAPEDRGQRREAVRLEALHEPGIEVPELLRGAEGAVLDVAARPPRDLRDLVGPQGTRALAVELPEVRERHVVDVEVQPHADGVGGHQVVHLARLVEADLRVAGARAQGAENEGHAADFPPHGLGDAVELGQGEDDDGRPPG